MAYHDFLTGLPNRRYFQEQLNDDLLKAGNAGSLLAVCFVDMDSFKYINDSLGHRTGDLLLKQVAQRLKHALGTKGTLYRMGGDEFVIVTEPLQHSDQIHDLITPLMKHFELPFLLEEQEVFITPSIGISFYPSDGRDVDSLIKKSDRAMYVAKELGRNTYQLYSPEWDGQYSKRLTMGKALRLALEREEFVLYYQPKVDIQSGKMVGMEALVRWLHPKEGLIPPSDFIPIAEETGLIIPLGKWVLQTACKQLKNWSESYGCNLTVAINLSAQQFKRNELTEEIARVIKDTKLPPQNLILEITESLSMDNAEKTMEQLHQLQLMGVNISIDDFGTGYSSLSYLKRFPVSSLKIDRSFIRDIPADGDDASIVQTIVVLAHHLGIKVVAEGAETKEQLDFLLSIGCDEGQGYYFSKPICAEDFEALLIGR